jgi:polyhydroxyalkanoate synthesis regulator phasin
MATKTMKPDEVKEAPNGHEKEEHNVFYKAVRNVLLGSIGAVALSQDNIEDFVNKLVERGEIAEKDGRKLVREVMERRKKETKKAEDEVSKRIEEILERMQVPSKADIEALSEKITVLAKKVDELKKA